jgi:hypothetical protein
MSCHQKADSRQEREADSRHKKGVIRGLLLKKSAGEVLLHMPANEAIGSLPIGGGLRWLSAFSVSLLELS